jgi:hypothetical protein
MSYTTVQSAGISVINEDKPERLSVFDPYVFKKPAPEAPIPEEVLVAQKKMKKYEEAMTYKIPNEAVKRAGKALSMGTHPALVDIFTLYAKTLPQ